MFGEYVTLANGGGGESWVDKVQLLLSSLASSPYAWAGVGVVLAVAYLVLKK